MRSAINFFTINQLQLEIDPFIKRVFKYFYQNKPLRPRYDSFWPVDKLLSFLKSWHPKEELSLEQLTYKTIALIAVSSSDRGQTLHMAKVDDIKVHSDRVEFVINEKTKGTRKILKPIIISCVVTQDESLDVAAHVLYYIEKTKEWRGDKGKLFLSPFTKRPVVKSTLAKWLVKVLHLSGIDTNKFKAHSYRGAGLSEAYKKGASINQIVAAGNWCGPTVFESYYNAPCQPTPVPNLILNS